MASMVKEILPPVFCSKRHEMDLVCCNSEGTILFYQCKFCNEVIKVEIEEDVEPLVTLDDLKGD
jgi:hypothetical protein